MEVRGEGEVCEGCEGRINVSVGVEGEGEVGGTEGCVGGGGGWVVGTCV